METPRRHNAHPALAARVGLHFFLAALGMTATTAGATSTCGSWNFVASPVPPGGTGILTAAAALTGSDAWAVGSTADGTETVTLHWDGSAWSVVPAPNPSTLGAQNLLVGVEALAHDDVWAVGAFNSSGGDSTGLPATQTLAIHWDGSAWSQVPSPGVVGGSMFDAVSALGPNELWAVGTRVPSGTGPVEVPLAARWDGAGWTQVAAPFVGNRLNRLMGVSARTSSDVWAVGLWKDTPSPIHLLILHWDGSTWSLSSAGDPGVSDLLLGVAAVASDDVWAVGERNDPVDGSQPLIVHWNGSSWSTIALPVFPGEFNRLNAIRAVSVADIWAAGASATVAGGPSQALLMHWDGSSWSQVAAGPSDGGSEYFGGLALISGCEAWAVGGYDRNGATVPLTERFEPVSLLPVPDGAPGEIGSSVFLSLKAAPNPARGEARLSMVLSRGAPVRVEVFDLRGRRVRVLSDRAASAGARELTWDGRDDFGAATGPGVYFVRVSAGAESRTVRLVLRP